MVSGGGGGGKKSGVGAQWKKECRGRGGAFRKWGWGFQKIEGLRRVSHADEKRGGLADL